MKRVLRMQDIAVFAVDSATALGAEYADMRIVCERQNRVVVERRSLKLIDETESQGYGIRVLRDGFWGFASSTDFSRDAVAATAHLAIQTAVASSAVPKALPSRMAVAPASVATLSGPCMEDPFAVSHSEKADLLLAATDAMLNVANVVTAFGVLQFIRRRRVIANSDGSCLDLTTTFANPILAATAVVGDESQSRQYQGGASQAGYEFIRGLDLPGQSRGLAEEAVLKCHAAECPQGVMDLVLDPMHLALTMHESVGHPTELDRILGWEANMAGRSFVRTEDVGSLGYGSDLVNFTVDNTMPDGLGSWFYDDDGVELHRYPLIRRGILVGLNTTRETVPFIGVKRSNGGCRADGFDRMPINRIPNLVMDPGADDAVTRDSLIAGVSRGIYIQGMGSFSIDQMRNNFQFGGDFFWRIENGELVEPLKKVTYQAQTRDFWSSCDAVAGAPDWCRHGVMTCGKGEPMQLMCMTHGASHTRFRNISVGGAKL
ncbi:MAG: TldD/PmbA family protein [Victivallales bacterium]|nr:TldD/PmbA family protein [Victivallales bacterium]